MTDHATAPIQLDARFFERLFTGAGLAVFTVDFKGLIQAWNPAAECMFRDRGEEVEGRSLREILPEQDWPVLEECLKSLLATHEPTEFRTRIGGEEQDAGEYAAWLTPIFDDRGELQSACVWLNDITVRVQLRRAMRKRERLTQLGTLAGSVAHHYNNLLCSIATSLEFALNMNTMSAMRRVLRRSADAIGRATQLTQQLLAFAQADHRMCDLADLTETVLHYFDQREAELADQGIKLDLSWERIPVVPLPREQFIVVLENLTQNASEAMPNGGVLGVVLRRHGEDAVLLAISDSGAGVSPGDMEHLFEPFFTTKGELGSGRTRQAGMGLAVVHGLISEMHGSISAVNRASGGALFEIVLPIDAES